MYGASELRVLAVIQPSTDEDAAAPAATTFRELMKYIVIIPRMSQMMQGTSRPGRCHVTLGLGMPQSNPSITGYEPAEGQETSPLLQAKPVDRVSFYPNI